MEFTLCEDMPLLNFGGRNDGVWRTDAILLGHDGSMNNLSTGREHGGLGSLTSSPDKKKIAWIEAKGRNGYESKYEIWVHDRKSGASSCWTSRSERFFSAIAWSFVSRTIYGTAGDRGRSLPYWIEHEGAEPKPIFTANSISSLSVLDDHRLLLSVSAVKSLDELVIYDRDLQNHREEHLTAWSLERGLQTQLKEFKAEEFWFKGADKWDVMAWVVKPPGYDSGRGSSWPMIFLIHGGPYGSFQDTWDPRWNHALFAAQGYFVVAINPTGSTGFGAEFCKRLDGSYAGRPFEDIMAGYKAVLAKYKGIDPKRTAVAGASYGGYMTNWIQGHNDQIGFKTIICHDGIFDTILDSFTGDNPGIGAGPYGGNPWERRDAWDEWNPMNHVAQWKTPQLVFHGGKDYRLDLSNGLAAFGALQLRKVPSRFVCFPDEPHSVQSSRNSLYWYKEIFDWLEKWIGARSVDQAAGASAV